MNSEKYQTGTVVTLQHCSEILKNNPLGDAHIRDVIVYLPPDYDENQSYPTVYALAGFTGRGRMMLNDAAFTPNFAERMDKLIAEGKIKPMIAVLPDCFTHYGGSQYINSSATGNYEDYLIKEIVPFVDENFRTIKDKNSRAVIGKSSGGYGALMMAMRHADTFGLACSTSGDCGFNYCYLPDLPKAFRAIKGKPKEFVEKFWDETAKKSKDDFSGLNIIGMSACYSPNPESEYGFDLPFDLQTGGINSDVWIRWIRHDPIFVMDMDRNIENLKSLKLLYIDAGTRDEFALDVGARILSQRLKEAGISHIHEEFDDGHFNISYRTNRSLEMISQHFG